MLATFHLTVLTALRDRLFLAMLSSIVLVWLLASFFGDTSVVEQGETSTVFAAFAFRLLIVSGIVLFTAVHLRRAFESREILLILSRPISRRGVVFAYWASLSFIAVSLIVPATLLLGVSLPTTWGGLAAWSVSLTLEAAMMVAFALFVALTINGIVAVALACLGFYVLARMIGFLIAITTSPFFDGAGVLREATTRFVEIASLALPRFDLFAQSHWLVYGVDDQKSFALIVAQGIVYTALLIAAAIFDLERKNF